MKTRLVALLGVASLAAGAQAQATLNMRVWDGASWSTSVQSSGGRVQCALFVGFPTQYYGLGGAVYNILGNGIVGDTVDIASSGLGRIDPFDVGINHQHVFLTADHFRIDSADDLNNSVNVGISSGQSTPFNNGHFNTDNPALIYRFDILVNAATGPRKIDLVAPLEQLKHHTVLVYAGPNSNSATSVSTVTSFGAQILVNVPAPASPGILTIGTLLMARRRRRIGL